MLAIGTLETEIGVWDLILKAERRENMVLKGPKGERLEIEDQ